MNEKIKEFCKKHGLTERQFYGKEEYSGSLYLSSLTSIPEGFNPTVGGSLYLRSLTSIPEGFNPTVGGYLDLRSLTSIPEGFNPTVGGYLDLSSLTSIPEGFNPTVGGSLYLRSGLSCETKPYIEFAFTWHNGKYIQVDDIFTEVVKKRGNVYHVKKLNTDKIFYLVTDGNNNWSHGDTLSEAREDLIYKTSSLDKSDFKGVDVNQKLSFADAVRCYRVITGSCSFGVKNFIESNNIKKKKYSISDILKLTKGAYGHESFKTFFNK